MEKDNNDFIYFIVHFIVPFLFLGLVRFHTKNAPEGTLVAIAYCFIFFLIHLFLCIFGYSLKKQNFAIWGSLLGNIISILISIDNSGSKIFP